MPSLISPQLRPEVDLPDAVSAARGPRMGRGAASRHFEDCGFVSRRLRVSLAILAATAWLIAPGAKALNALNPQAAASQAQAAPTPARAPAKSSHAAPSPAKKTVHHRHRASAKLAHAQAPPDPAPVAVDKVPPRPKFPAFDHAEEASVVWDAQGLSIDATNSSLQQIMSSVSTDIGVKVDGLNSDQRVFGKYGPGKASDVLSQLLQGSGYNVIMIGDQGQGTPREVMLSQRQNTAAQPAPRNNPTDGGADDEDQQEEPPAPQPDGPPFHPNFQPGGPPRSPQQIMQEMQQRQQQQQDQPPQPPN